MSNYSFNLGTEENPNVVTPELIAKLDKEGRSITLGSGWSFEIGSISETGDDIEVTLKRETLNSFCNVTASRQVRFHDDVKVTYESLVQDIANIVNGLIKEYEAQIRYSLMCPEPTKTGVFFIDENAPSLAERKMVLDNLIPV